MPLPLWGLQENQENQTSVEKTSEKVDEDFP